MGETAKNQVMNFRVFGKDKKFFTAAAEVQGLSLSDFAIEAMQLKSEEVLMDREVLGMNNSAWKKLHSILEGPIQDNPEFRQKMAKPSPWGK